MGIKPAIGVGPILRYKGSSMRPLVVKLLFHFTCWLLLQLSIELAASLNVRRVFASNELLSVLALLARHLMLHLPKGDSGSAGVTEGGTIPSMSLRLREV